MNQGTPPTQNRQRAAPPWVRRVTYWALGLAFMALGQEGWSKPRVTGAELPALIQKAVEQHPEVQEAERQLEASQAGRRKSAATFYPRLALEGGPLAYRDEAESRTSFAGYLSGKMNLFRGGRDRLGLNASDLSVRVSELQLTQAKRKIAREVEQAYIRLVALQEHIGIHQEEITRNTEQIKMAQKKAAGGLTSQADLYEFQFREAGLKSDLLLKEQERRTLILELSKLMGQTFPEDYRAVGTVDSSERVPSTDSLLALAESNHLALAEAKAEESAAGLSYRGALGYWLPEVDLEAQYGKLAFDKAEVAPGLAGEVALKISIPLFSGFEGIASRTEAAKLQEKWSARQQGIRRDLQAEVRSQVLFLKVLDERIEIEKENVERARHYYDMTVTEYRRGIKNSPDLAGATERLYEAKARRVDLNRDRAIAILSLESAVGTDFGGRVPPLGQVTQRP